MRATTSIRARRTSRPSRSCLNGVMGDSFQRWKRLLGARKRSAFAPTLRRPYGLFESGWGFEPRPGRPCAIACLRPVLRPAPGPRPDTESVGAGLYCTTG